MTIPTMKGMAIPVEDSPALELHRVAKLYGRTAALKALSLRLERGETLALLGPNGSGKTTLLKILSGAITPTLGQGRIFGHDIVTGRRVLRSQVAMLATDSYLYDDLTARENTRFIATMAGLRPSDDEVDRALGAVHLSARSGERVRSFSSGMKRRLALARFFLLQPKLLLLDEPYNSLDVGGADIVDTLVRQAAEQGRASVLATHDAERALGLANSVAELHQGALIYYGRAREYRQRYAEHVG